MEQDIIKEIGIDKAQRLYIKPANQKFIYIYREAMEVNWDNEEQILYGAKPRK